MLSREPTLEEAPSVGEDFAAYVVARGPALLRLAVVLTGNESDAQDLVQEALSRALPRWDRIARVEDPDAYVRRMVLNAHVSWWRRVGRRESPVAEVRHPGTVPAAADSASGHESEGELWAACLRLPWDQRVAVVLRYYEQLSYAEIAGLTGVAEVTARSRVHRGLATLRKVVGDD